jgi:hypothetical protein
MGRDRNKLLPATQFMMAASVFVGGCCNRRIASEAITYRSRKNIWPICLACDARPLRCSLRSYKNEVPSGTAAVR